MIDDAIAVANSLKGLDFKIESASAKELVIQSYVDDPSSMCCRLRFKDPSYFQLRPYFSHRTLVKRDLSQLLQGPKRNPLLALQGAHPALPGFPLDEIPDALAEGHALFVFQDSDNPDEGSGEPDLCVLAAQLVVESA